MPKKDTEGRTLSGYLRPRKQKAVEQEKDIARKAFQILEALSGDAADYWIERHPVGSMAYLVTRSNREYLRELLAEAKRMAEENPHTQTGLAQRALFFWQVRYAESRND